ncbi:MAG: hypothetical protein WC975_15280, partial [Phycisphaerae bacterium]
QKVFCLCDPQSFVRKSYPITENIMAQVLLKIRITRHFMRLPCLKFQTISMWHEYRIVGAIDNP